MSAGTNIWRFQDICDDYVRKIYTSLSDDEITQATFWSKLKEHHSRRNSLVHPGQSGTIIVSPSSLEEAEASFKAVEDYIQHIHGVLNPIQS